MLTQRSDGAVQREADRADSLNDAVRPFQFQRQQPQLIGQLGDIAAAVCRAVSQVATRAVNVPAQIARLLQSRAQIVHRSEPFRIEHADSTQRLRKLGNAPLQLPIQVASRPRPLALHQSGLTRRQVNAEVGCAAAGAPFSPRADPVPPQCFAQQDLDRFLTDVFVVVLARYGIPHKIQLSTIQLARIG